MSSHRCTSVQPLTADAARSFEDGLKLVKLRGESMQAAADATPSAMVSVIGLDADKVMIIAAHAMSRSNPIIETCR